MRPPRLTRCPSSDPNNVHHSSKAPPLPPVQCTRYTDMFCAGGLYPDASSGDGGWKRLPSTGPSRLLFPFLLVSSFLARSCHSSGHTRSIVLTCSAFFRSQPSQGLLQTTKTVNDCILSPSFVPPAPLLHAFLPTKRHHSTRTDSRPCSLASRGASPHTPPHRRGEKSMSKVAGEFKQRKKPPLCFFAFLPNLTTLFHPLSLAFSLSRSLLLLRVCSAAVPPAWGRVSPSPPPLRLSCGSPSAFSPPCD